MNPVPWIVMLALAIAALVRGVQFRRGTNTRMLALYRRASEPAIYRNLPIVLPVVGLVIIAVVSLAALRLLSLTFNLPIPVGVRDFAGLMSVASLLIGFATILLLLYKPPRWIVPAWLKDDDGKISYVPPKPGLFDRLALLVALVSSAFGVVVVCIGILALVT